MDAPLIWHMPHFWVFFLNRKCILLKKFRFYIYWESLHTEMQILDVNQIYQTKNWAECFSNQDLNEISPFSYLRGPRPWYQGKPWVHYTRGASAQWTPAWFLNKDKSWIKYVDVEQWQRALCIKSRNGKALHEWALKFLAHFVCIIYVYHLCVDSLFLFMNILVD